MALHAAGIRTAVAPMGTAFTKEHAQVLKRYCSEITIVFDQDNAGIDAALKAMPVLEEYEFSITVAVLPEGKDPADLLQQNDLETLKKCINFTRNGFQYLVETLVKRYDVNLPEGKESVFQNVLPCINAASSEIRKNEYLRTAAEVLGLDEHVIYDDFNRRKKQAGKRTAAAYQSAGGENSKKADAGISIHSNPELYLLSALYYAPSLFKKFRTMLPYELLADKTAKELYTHLEDSYREGIKDIDIIISRLDNVDIQNFIVKELESDKYRDNTERIIRDGIAMLRSGKLIRKRKDIVKRIQSLEECQDAESVKTVQNLLFEKKYLDEEIEKIRNSV
jgi:DNA primase